MEFSRSQKYGILCCDWRDMKAYKWGADLDEPIEVWSRYDENGNVNKFVEMNKGKLADDKI